MNDDLQHLRLLSIFHYIVGGMAALFACIPLLHIALGVFMVFVPGALESDGGDAMPAVVGWVFIIVGAGVVLLGWAFAVCVILAGRFLARQVHYLYCMVMGAIECIFTPFGTVLGVFTIILLAKPSAKKLFTRKQARK